MSFEGVHANFVLPPAFETIPEEIAATFRIEVTHLCQFSSVHIGSAIWVSSATVTSPGGEQAQHFFTSFCNLSELTIANDGVEYFGDSIHVPLDPTFWPTQLRWQQRAAEIRRHEVREELINHFDLAAADGQDNAVLELVARGACGEWIGTEIEDAHYGTMLDTDQIASVIGIDVAGVQSASNRLLKAVAIREWGARIVPIDWKATAIQKRRHRAAEMFSPEQMQRIREMGSPDPGGLEPPSLD